MGDIWPYGPPQYLKYDQVYAVLRNKGVSKGDAEIFAAIGEAESSLDLSVINDTPSTGDYSVGIWQINYFNGLYHDRAKAFGTPKELIQNGIDAQVFAATSIQASSGFTAWSTYNSGAYKQYLQGSGVPSGTAPGIYVPIPPPTDPGNDSWSKQVKDSAYVFHRVTLTFGNTARAIDLVRR